MSRFGKFERFGGVVLASSLLLGSGCGSSKKDAKNPTVVASPEGDLDPAEIVPSGTDWVVRIDGRKLRGTPLLPAMVAVVREQGGAQVFDEVRKACEFPLSGVVEQAVVFTRGHEWAMAMRPSVTADEALDCARKLARGAASSKEAGAFVELTLPWVTRTGVRSSRVLVAGTRGGLFVLGDRALVRAAVDAPRDPNGKKRYVLDGQTVGLADGAMLGDIPFDARLDATRSGFSLVFRAHLPSPEIAKRGEELIVQRRELAFAKARSPLAREVLRSLRVEARGAELDVNLGTEGDSAAQEKYLDVLVGLARLFFETYERSAPDAVAAPPAKVPAPSATSTATP